MNMTRKHIYPLMILIIFGLIIMGCSSPSRIVPIETQSAVKTMPTIIATMTASAAPQNTPTMTAIMTVTSTPQSMPIKMAPFYADLSCWQMKSLQAGSGIKGSLLFAYGDSGFFYWDVSSFHAKFFADKIPGWGLLLSSKTMPPDRSSIPIDSPEHKILFTAIDHSSVTLNIPPGGHYFNYLLNGKIIFAPDDSQLDPPVDNEIYQEGVGYTTTYYIYDPKTGEQLESHSVFLPKFTFYHPGAGIYFAQISYSPDGKFVLYRSTLLNGKDGFSLLDLSSNQVKWTIPESNKINGVGEIQNGYSEPTWRPDAGSLTYIWASKDTEKTQNFYDITLDGTITQFTRVDEVFQSGYALNYQPKWSPDNHYMVFTVQMSEHPYDRELFIWDDVNKILLDPCLPVNYYGFDWSLNSKHLLIGLPYSDKPSHVLRHLMLDIPNKLIYELPNDEDMRNYLKLSGNISNYSNGFWMNWEIP